MRTLYLSLCCTAMLATVPAFGLETLPLLQLAQSYQQMELVSDFWISEKLFPLDFSHIGRVACTAIISSRCITVFCFSHRYQRLWYAGRYHHQYTARC